MIFFEGFQNIIDKINQLLLMDQNAHRVSNRNTNNVWPSCTDEVRREDNGCLW